VENVTSQEAEKISGGRFEDPPYPWAPAEVGLDFIWGKCSFDEIIGSDGKCYKTSMIPNSKP
jgi:hypothetical protein